MAASLTINAESIQIVLFVLYLAGALFHFAWASYLIFVRRFDLSFQTASLSVSSPILILGGLILLNFWPLMVLSSGLGLSIRTDEVLILIASLMQTGHFIYEATLWRKAAPRRVFVLNHAIFIAILISWYLARISSHRF